MSTTTIIWLGFFISLGLLLFIARKNVWLGLVVASYVLGLFSLSVRELWEQTLITLSEPSIVLLAIVISAIINHRRMFILKLMTVGIGLAVWLNVLVILRFSVAGIEHQAGRADPASFAIFIAIITGVSLAAYVVARLASRFLVRRRHRLSHNPHQ